MLFRAFLSGMVGVALSGSVLAVSTGFAQSTDTWSLAGGRTHVCGAGRQRAGAAATIAPNLGYATNYPFPTQLDGDTLTVVAVQPGY